MPYGALTHATNTPPIDNSTYYTLDSQYASSNIKVGDYLLYVDSGTIKQLFSVVSISNNTLELALMGQYGGGKQLYQHNIIITNTSLSMEMGIVIENDNPNAMTINDIKDFYQAMYDLSSPTYKKHFGCKGKIGTNVFNYASPYLTGTTLNLSLIDWGNTGRGSWDFSITTLEDTIITL